MNNIFKLEINAKRYDNMVDIYIDGNLTPMKWGETLFIEKQLESGNHTLRIERASLLTGKWWFLKIIIFTLIGFLGSIPPEFEKGKIYNTIFEANFTITENMSVEMILGNNFDDVYFGDFGGLEVTKNETFQDKRLEKRRRYGKLFVPIILIVLIVIIGLLSGLLS